MSDTFSLPSSSAQWLFRLVHDDLLAREHAGKPVPRVDRDMAAALFAAYREHAETRLGATTLEAAPQQIGPLDQAVNVSAAAQMLGLKTTQAVRAAIARGRLDAIKDGEGEWQIQREALETYRQSRWHRAA